MPPFPEPTFPFDYQVDEELAALRRWRDTQPSRAIPTKDDMCRRSWVPGEGDLPSTDATRHAWCQHHGRVPGTVGCPRSVRRSPVSIVGGWTSTDSS
jgi:hypothetical protein